eukprot:UN06072
MGQVLLTPKYWIGTGFAFGLVTLSAYLHSENRRHNRMIEQQYWDDDMNKMHGYFRLKI